MQLLFGTLDFLYPPTSDATAPKKAGNGTVELQIGVSSRKKRKTQPMKNP